MKNLKSTLIICLLILFGGNLYAQLSDYDIDILPCSSYEMLEVKYRGGMFDPYDWSGFTTKWYINNTYKGTWTSGTNDTTNPRYPTVSSGSGSCINLSDGDVLKAILSKTGQADITITKTVGGSGGGGGGGSNPDPDFVRLVNGVNDPISSICVNDHVVYELRNWGGDAQWEISGALVEGTVSRYRQELYWLTSGTKMVRVTLSDGTVMTLPSTVEYFDLKVIAPSRVCSGEPFTLVAQQQTSTGGSWSTASNVTWQYSTDNWNTVHAMSTPNVSGITVPTRFRAIKSLGVCGEDIAEALVNVDYPPDIPGEDGDFNIYYKYLEGSQTNVRLHVEYRGGMFDPYDWSGKTFYWYNDDTNQYLTSTTVPYYPTNSAGMTRPDGVNYKLVIKQKCTPDITVVRLIGGSNDGGNPATPDLIRLVNGQNDPMAEICVGDHVVYKVKDWYGSVSWNLAGGTLVGSNSNQYQAEVYWNSSGNKLVKVTLGTSSTITLPSDVEYFDLKVNGPARVCSGEPFTLQAQQQVATGGSWSTASDVTWQYSTDNWNTVHSLAGANVGGITVPTIFRARKSYGTCGEGIAELLVNVDSRPAPPQLDHDYTCSQNVVRIVASGGTDYRWYMSDASDAPPLEDNGSIITSDTYNTPLMQGTSRYYSTIINQNGCESDKALAEIVSEQLTSYCNNYIRTFTALSSDIQKNEFDLNANPDRIAIRTDYYDGLGRPDQLVIKQNSPLRSDVVRPFVYDSYGREHRHYLPVVVGETNGWYKYNILDVDGFYAEAAGNFYSDPASPVANDSHPFSEIIYEPSPLNRVIEQGAHGEAWQPVEANPQTGKTVKYEYYVNEASDSVKKWMFGFGLLGNTLYSDGQLTKTITIDEEGYKTIEFVDKLGQTILKRVQVHENGAITEEWAETYYIYDDYGNLQFVLPPMANKKLAEGVISDDIFRAQWTFCYKYDHRKRLIEKRVPGADWIYMVYDKRDRLVLTQDGSQRIKGEWLFTKYDALNRSILTGIYNHSGDRATVQNEVNDFYEYNIQWDQMAGVSYEDGIFIKTAAYNWGNGGASSFTLLEAGEDGKISVEATETSSARMFGLSEISDDHHYNTIDFAIYLKNNSEIVIFESGVQVSGGSVGTYNTGDILSVERAGGTIYYKKNNQVLYTSTKTSTSSLLVDMAFSHEGGTLKFLMPEWYEEKDDRWGNIFGYSNSSFPYVSKENSYLSVTYYDNYDFHHAVLPDYAFIPDEDHSTYFSRVKGLVTGTKTRILGEDRWISTVNYYDDKYRVIQTVSNNHKEGTERMSNTYDFVGKVLESKLTHFQPMKVIWKNLRSVTAAGTMLTSNTTANWSAGASSANTLAENEDGWLETTVMDTETYKFIGFNEWDDSHSYGDIDYAVYFYGNSLRTYTNGSSLGAKGTIKAGDRVRMERVNGEVRVLVNNDLVYTFEGLSTTPLSIDAALSFAPASLGYVTCSFGTPDAKAPYPVLWTGMKGVYSRPDSLVKNGTSGWTNGGASSINKLGASEDGWASFKVASPSEKLMFGLSDRDESLTYHTIDYAIYLHEDSLVLVYENGNTRGWFSEYQPGDVFSIERNNGTITYLQNGQVFYTSEIPSATELVVDVTINTTNSTVYEARTSFGYVSPTETQTDITRSYDYDHAGRLLKTYHEVTETIQWVQRNNTTVNGNTIEKTSGTDYVWDAGAESANILPAGRDGWIEMTADRNNRSLFFGLSEYSADDNWNTIDNAFYLTGGGQIQIRRAPSGTNFLGYARGYQPGDIFRIERKDTDLHFYHNGELIHTRSDVSNTNLKVDISFYQIGSRITDAKMGFGKVLLAENRYNELGELIEKNLHSEDAGGTFEQSVDYRYNIRGWLTNINNASLTDASNNNDAGQPKDLFGMELGYNNQFAGINSTPIYNGKISAVKWSNNLGLDDLKQRGYSYTYNPMNMLESAQHHRQLINTWGSVGDYSVSGLTYDLQGNIRSLTRRDQFGGNMDVLNYTYDGNQLTSVTDAGNIDQGFKDGNTVGLDFEYNLNGGMIRDRNKGIDTVYYNYLNLIEKVVKEDGQYIKYIYSASGVKLGQEIYNASDNLQKRTDYIGEFIFENDTLQFIQHEEGRVVKDAEGAPIYEYFLRDHQGNNRLVFTTRPESYEFAATMEQDKSVEEESMFSNMEETRERFPGAAQSPDHVAMLTPSQPAGPGISLPVNPGDTVRMEGYAYYEGGSGYSQGIDLDALISAVATGFGGATGTGATEAQQAIYNSFDNAYGIIGANITGEDNVPAAFLNYILFDKNMTYKRSGFKQISSAANFSKEHVVLGDDIIASEAGFIYCYVTMESATGAIYWDDFKVTLNEGKVQEISDYYPFGLLAQSSQRISAKENSFKYNGKELQKDLGLDLYYYGLRMYDPAYSRWLSPDPLADEYYSYSPYNYTLNDPVLLIDPDGAVVEDPVKNVMVLVGDIGERVKNAPDNENWHIIRAENFEDAHKQIQEYTKGEFELDNLVIREHGVEGKIATDNFNTYIESGDVKAFNDYGEGATENQLGLLKPLSQGDYDAIKSLKALSGNVAEGGNVIISSCTACAGESGKALGNELVELFEGRVNVYMNQDKSFLSDKTIRTTVTNSKGTTITEKTLSAVVGAMSNPDKGWVMFPRDGSGPVPLNSSGNQGGIKINPTGANPFQKY